MDDRMTCVQEGATFKVETGIVNGKLCFQIFRNGLAVAGRPITFSEFWAIATNHGTDHALHVTASETEYLVEVAQGEAVTLQISAPVFRV